jgi:hypothetical protein
MIMSEPAIDIGIQTDKITILYGGLPVIAVAIHNKERNTVEIARKLHQDLGTYAFIYHGDRETCWRGTQDAMYGIIDNIVAYYGRAGIISLHRRKHKIRVAEPKDRNLVELGTLSDQSLDIALKGMFKERLDEHGVIFDDNIKFTGGQEIRGVHKRYNNPNYVKGNKNSYDASSNKVQIAQLEINADKSHVPEHYMITKILAETMLR